MVLVSLLQLRHRPPPWWVQACTSPRRLRLARMTGRVSPGAAGRTPRARSFARDSGCCAWSARF